MEIRKDINQILDVLRQKTMSKEQLCEFFELNYNEYKAFNKLATQKQIYVKEKVETIPIYFGSKKEPYFNSEDDIFKTLEQRIMDDYYK